ncbi:GNAT family N-acetyltransferase [Bacillus weihaiensis]|uniref:GNAT family acetyltransferase n=1 Tax=Bacillus weihaiensis TaxID=1547283 RepID=A0A1L3MQZ0_9BACI|nr:GNAT family acetyltransferase [Bacillus weihaiensis]
MANTINSIEFISKNGQSVRLRHAEEEDAKNIIEAVNEIITSGTYIQKERARSEKEEIEFIKEMKRLNNMYTVIEMSGEIVGIARVIRGELEMKRHIGLFRTWMIQSAQQNGIGTEVMKYTLKWCEDHNLHKLCLTVFSSNGLAQKLYERYGFVTEGTQREQVLIDNKYEDEIFMAYFFA